MIDAARQKRLLTFILDIFFLALIIAFSYFLISFYKDANFIRTGYVDWMIHGFRVKNLDQVGFTSWNHIWSNGLNLWKGYQFLPHFIVLSLVKLFHLEYLRAMVVLTLILFCFIHVQIYLLSRLLGFNPLVSFMAGLFSVSFGQFWGNINDFSIFVGVSFSPLIYFVWAHYQKGNVRFIFPFLIGLCFYMHPILAFYGLTLWIITFLFSAKNLFSLTAFLETFLFLAASSLFWLPLIIKDGYGHTQQSLSTADFLNKQLQAYSWYGTSLSIALLYIVSWIQVFFDYQIVPRWSKILLGFTLVMIIFIYIGTHFTLPQFLNTFQHTRGLVILGIAGILASLPLMREILASNNFIIKSLLVLISAYSVFESIFISSTFSANPGKIVEDPFQIYLQRHHDEQIKSARIWADSIDTTSYMAPKTLRITNSYEGHLEPNMIPERLTALVYYQPYGDFIPPLGMNRLNDYFKLTGTKYLLLNEALIFSKSLINPVYGYGYRNLGQIALTDSLWHAFQVPWKPVESGLLTNSQVKYLSLFPAKLNFSDPADQLKMDELTHSIANVIYSKDTIPITPQYPGPEDITLNIPSGKNYRKVYLNESYSNSWVATINGQMAKVDPVGPYYMLITLPANASGTLYMHHNWPLSYHIAVFALGGAVLVIIGEAILSVILKRRSLKHNSLS